MSATTSQQHGSADRSLMIKGGLAALVTIACIVFVVWALWPKGQVVIQEQATPAAAWTKAYGALSADHATKRDAFYLATARVNTEPTPDNQGVVVRGKVNTAAELALLKDELGKLQPSVPLDWQVVVSRQ